MILRKLSDSRFSEVLPTWEGKTCVLIGGGPSLTTDQVEAVRVAHVAGRVKCIGINNAYLWAPWADVNYAADAYWHKWHSDGVDMPVIGLSATSVRQQWRGFKGEKCTIECENAVVADKAVHVLRNLHYEEHTYGLSHDPKTLVTGLHSGWQAINLATLAGATTLLLLAYDAQPGPYGQAHWHGEHPKAMSHGAYDHFKLAFVEGAAALEDAGVRVINCSPRSAIEQFEKMEIQKALCIECAAAAV